VTDSLRFCFLWGVRYSPQGFENTFFKPFFARAELTRRGHGEGSIHQKPNRKWVARYRAELPNGRRVRRSITANSRKEAQQKLVQALAERDKAGGVLNDDRLTLGDLLDKWLVAK
jgi:hypothetical protein